VDVEKIYLKLFEIAPSKFGWRTRADLPNFQYGHQALGRLEKDVFPEFVIRTSANQRMVSATGRKWVERNEATFRGLGDKQVVLPPRGGESARVVRQVQASPAWATWTAGGEMHIEDLGAAFGCSPTSSGRIWTQRVDSFSNHIESRNDAELEEFLQSAKEVIRKEVWENG